MPQIPREAASTPRPRITPDEPVAPPARADKPALAAVGGAKVLGRSESSEDAGTGFLPSTVVSPSTEPGDEGSSGAEALLLLAAAVLAYAGWRLAVYLRLLLGKRRLQEEFRRQDEEWEATLRQIELSKAKAASNGNGNGSQPRRLKIAPELEPDAVGSSGAAGNGSRPARSGRA